MSRRRSSVRILDESAVYVSKSPVSSIKQTGNLTGNVRVARDHVADLCNLFNNWNEKVIEGSKYVSLIGNIMGENVGKTKTYADTMTTIGPYLQSLSEICSSMENIVKRMDATKVALSALQKLEEFQNQSKPLFLTWSVGKFVDVVVEICTMYQKELEFKLRVKEDLYFCEDAKLLTFYSVAWLQQPYIEKSSEFYQNAMEKEVGFSR